MPVITFEAGKLTKEQKQIAAKEFTEIAHKVTNAPKEAITVLIKENEPDNVAVSGTLLSNRK
ncbi:4-oxalocrotonate tautomerase [Clostridium sp. DSM 8431]|uniref:4-oxalocrotonate tautomerase DmpI n=1 Tax=Clostridium sp. DSM 8431 TaxID=1761781 RepID=UPI0008E1EEC3|nr:4-oxalocrotonate tautomerase DmpI [Clostridium sp. DSM 8431]SFU31754.1 4-oxalocrotonate tautomerase [Clostridium sp. DSM 8431]